MRNLDFFFVILCCFAAFQTASSQGTDTLKQGDSSTQLLLVSANQLFVLGFYRPPPQDPPNVYLAIWYNNNGFYISAQNNTDDYTSQHPVWIGNRNTPIRNNSALLFLDSYGNLFIRGNGIADSFPLYSSVSQTRIKVTATLLDSGNFVVRETNSNGLPGPLLWQSFDYPTDTLLPEMKLGVNYRTGKNLTLTSWFSDTSPRDGAFSLEWDPQNLRLVVRYRGVIHWTSGSLTDRVIEGFKERVFEFFRPGKYSGNYEFIREANDDGDYFYYRVYYRVKRSYSNTSAWLLDSEGTMYDTKDHYKIAVMDSCYGTINRSPNMFYAQGCESWEQPKCRNSHLKFNDTHGEFIKPSGELAHSSSLKGENISSSDCREECWRHCNCFGYLFDNLGCHLWRGQKLKFRKDPDSTARPYVLISDKPNIMIQEKPKQKPNVLISEASNKRKSKKWIPIPIAAAVLVLLATLLVGLFFYLKRKSRREKEKELLELMTLDGYTETIILKKDGKKGQDVKFFSYSCIMSATNNFSPQNKLGQGGFGPVYKGQLPEGQEIAVKRLSKSSEQGLHEFKTELLLIAKLQHTNLVRLFGCCIHGDEKMLIYEYMPNKSLDFFLFEQTSGHHLSWERRFIIIEGIAQGLLYLHKYSRLRIIHRDLKASNILLDENMNPKISDFGTARIFKKNLIEESTIKITGTRGYMAPEYILEGTFSIKSDVFSFGVLMLEIVSGRKNNSLYDIQGSRINLVAYAWELWNINSEIELMDSALSGSSDIHDQVQRCIRIGLLCVQHSAILRPTMSDVISMLSNDNSALPVPGPPAFSEGSSSSKGNTDSSSSKGNIYRMKSDKNSESGISISEVRAR